MVFVPYTTAKSNHFAQPIVSIWTNGQMSLSAAAIARFNVNSFSHVLFSYDQEGQRVGLSFTNDAAMDGARFITRRRGVKKAIAGALFWALPFLQGHALGDLQGQFVLVPSDKPGCDCYFQIKASRG